MVVTDLPETTCCPSGQHLEPNPAVAAPLVAGTGSPAANRAALADCLRPGPADVVDDVAGRLPLDPVPSPRQLYQALQQAHTQRAGGRHPLPADQAALLLQALADLTVRDAACAWSDDAAAFLWADLLPTAPAGWIAPVAAVAATTAYQRGNAVLADMAAAWALHDDPGYALAHLVIELANIQVHPDQLRHALTGAIAEILRLHPDLTDLADNDHSGERHE